MRAVIQRVSAAGVDVDGECRAEIGAGLMILLGISKSDGIEEADKLAEKTAELRIFEDENGKMNLSLLDVGGAALVVSNFTLYGDCSHGRRPSFMEAQRPQQAKELYEYFIKKLKFNGVGEIGEGVFGADMQVHIDNDGPVTLILDTEDLNVKK